MNQPPPDQNDAPSRGRRRFRGSVPLLAGSVIAAAGLVFGSLTAASALPFSHGLRRPVGLHHDGVQVRHPQVHLQPRLFHRG
jgi:hypothetical protein